MAFIGYVCGTDLDPQDRAKIVREMTSAGMLLASSNAEAAAMSAAIVAERAGNSVVNTLFEQDLKVVNIGLQSFAVNVTTAGGKSHT